MISLESINWTARIRAHEHKAPPWRIRSLENQLGNFMKKIRVAKGFPITVPSPFGWGYLIPNSMWIKPTYPFIVIMYFRWVSPVESANSNAFAVMYHKSNLIWAAFQALPKRGYLDGSSKPVFLAVKKTRRKAILRWAQKKPVNFDRRFAYQLGVFFYEKIHLQKLKQTRKLLTFEYPVHFQWKATQLIVNAHPGSA